MRKSRLSRLARQFHENGLKFLLENFSSVRELLSLTGTDLLDQIDFAALRPARSTFVARDYRHVEADVVYRVPLLPAAGSRSRRSLWQYLLIELQSEPEPLMPLRLPDYVLQIFKAQVRECEQAHAGKTAGLRLQPVLPVVLYTGRRRWDAVGKLEDLIERGSQFRRFIPALEPLFVNVGRTPAGQLATAGGALGQVLRLLRESKARSAAFQTLLDEVVRGLEPLAKAERRRWLELLSYVRALVYNKRDPSEHAALGEVIETAVESDRRKKEVRSMGRTIAQALEAKGRRKGRTEGKLDTLKNMLLRLLTRRFRAVPESVTETINGSTDVHRLEVWVDNFATAETLEDVGIEAGE